jgi:general secretion pathway protein G
VHRKLPRDKGFTLLEILFSTMIVGVLSAIAIPVYNGHLDKMHINNAIADINFIQICIERYHTETFRYPPTISEITSCLPNSGLDPWGKAYVYLNLIDDEPGNKGLKGADKPKGDDKGDDKKRKDHKENPINTLYDLYSKGKDGLSKQQLDNKESVDDVVLAHDGAFIGLASNF